jgi:beta-xylosidase
VHLQPVTWRADGWPVIGLASADDTQGTPVSSALVPTIASGASSAHLQTSDEFAGPTLGLQWQWQANPREDWVAIDSKAGVMSLRTQPLAPPSRNLWDAPNLLLQKFPSTEFEVATRFVASARDSAERFGLVVFGRDYAWLGLRHVNGEWQLVSTRVKDADKGAAESVEVVRTLAAPDVQLRLRVKSGGVCHFAYSVADEPFVELPASFTAREGMWVGAKVGVFASRDASAAATGPPGEMRVDYFRVRIL